MAHSSRRCRHGVLLFGLFAILAAGCLGAHKCEIQNAKPLAPIAQKQVKTAGACIDLGEGHQAAYTPEQFVAKANELLSSGRQISAEHFVADFPDLCQESLRRLTTAEAGSPGIQLIARIHDAQAGLTRSNLSWEAIVNERRADSKLYAAYDSARQMVMSAQHENRCAGLSTLTKAATHPLLELDAHRLAGESLLQAEKPDQAAIEFEVALKLTQPNYIYQAVQIQLLLGEAKRRAGKIEQAVGMWQQAVIMAGQHLNSCPALADPIFWETASALRPVNTAWPDPVVRAMVPTTAVRRSAGSDEAWLWKLVGNWRLERGEPQAALLAYKRAESMTAELPLQEDLQLLQATALAQLGQSAAAAALLTTLVDKQRPVISATALATLGSLKLQAGAGPQAKILLKKALEVSQSSDWPGRAEAEADFGLACLLVGDSAAGLQSLHIAQTKFEAAGNVNMLRQCLENEAAYMKRISKVADSERLQARIAALDREGSAENIRSTSSQSLP